MIVDEESGIQIQTVAILNIAGYEIETAASGRACLERLERGPPPDLLLIGTLDPETIAEIRSRFRVAHLFLIAATVGSETPPNPGSMCYGYVQKTVNYDTVLPLMVRAALERRGDVQRLQQEEASFRFFFENIPVAAIVSDPDYSVVQWNRAAEELFGYAREKVIGRDLMTVLASDRNNQTPAELKERLKTALEANRTSRNVNYDRTRDGRDILCQWFDFPYRKDGRDFILSVAMDITREQELLDSLQTAVRQKDFLMQEIYHRLKNNLNMIISLISLKIGELEAKARVSASDEQGDRIAPLQDIQQKIGAFSILYDMLHQRAGSVQSLDLALYLEELLSTVFISMTEEPCRVETRMDSVTVAPQTAVVLGLITNEIATNALKYGFVPGGERTFTTTLRVTEGFCEYTLANSGNPFPDEVDPDRSSSLGMQLINSLVQQLHGTVALVKTPSARYTIRIPLEPAPETVTE